MTRREAEQLKVGDVVMWEMDADDLGDVIEVGYCCVKIRWRSQPEGKDVGLNHVGDMANIARAPRQAVR